MKLNYKLNLWILTSILACSNVNAQTTDRALLHQVASENQDAVNAIALYPTDTRKIIYLSAEYPDVIIKLYVMQSASQSSFEKLINQLSQEEQDRIWNLTRYDGLIADLISGQIQSTDDLNNVLLNYPEEIRQTAKLEQQANLKLLQEINQLNVQYNSDFETLLSSYPTDVAYGFREVIKIPAVLKLLYDHMSYTMVIGQYYKKNPDRVIHKTDSLYQVLTSKNNQELLDWQQSLQNDPASSQQFLQANQEYAQYNDSQLDDYNASVSQDQIDQSTPSFTWWFGYPSWYPDDYWTPFPYWNESGCYINTSGQAVFMETPSVHFMQWYFTNPEHFVKYPALSNNFYNYYENHPKSINNNTISRIVSNWKSSNRAIVFGTWDTDNANRTERFRQLGLLESNLKAYNSGNPNQTMLPEAYLQENQNKFSLLSVNASKTSKYETTSQYLEPPARLPSISNPNKYKTAAALQSILQPRPQPVTVHYQKQTTNSSSSSGYSQSIPLQTHYQNHPNTVTQTTTTSAQTSANHVNPPTYRAPVQNNSEQRAAQQYHQNTWQQPQESRPQERSAPEAPRRK